MTSRLAVASLAVTALVVLAACDREAPWASPNSTVATPPVIASVPAASSTLPAELKAESTVTEPEDAHEPAKMLGEQRLTRTDFDAMRLLATTSQGALQAYTDWAEGLKAMAEDYPVYAHILDDQVPAEAQLKTQLRAIYLSLEARAAELREHENDRAALDEVKDWRRSMEQQLTERGVQQAALEKRLKELDDAAAANAEQAVAALAEVERAAVANANTVAGEPPTSVEAPGRPEGRSRKPQVVKRREERPEPQRSAPGSTAAQQHQEAHSGEHAPAAASPQAAEAAPPRKKSKHTERGKSAKAQSKTDLAFETAGGAFDPADVAGAFMRDDFGEGRDSLGEVALDQFASAARLHALETGKVSFPCRPRPRLALACGLPGSATHVC